MDFKGQVILSWEERDGRDPFNDLCNVNECIRAVNERVSEKEELHIE